MAYYTGYVTIPHSSYNEWRNATNGNGYNYDNSYGCQCYDLVAEFWWNIGFPAGYPIIDQSSAYRMWYYRDQNASYNNTVYFDLIYNVTDIKRGDIIVFNQFSGNQYGHVGFADEDYSTWTPDPNQQYEFPILSENNQGTPDPQGGAYTNIHGYDIRLFLGAFRYKDWNTPAPIPSFKGNFKWVLYAKKLREKHLF